MKWLSTLCGLIAVMHGVMTVALKPANAIGLWGVPELTWAGLGIASGLAGLLLSYSVFWRRR